MALKMKQECAEQITDEPAKQLEEDRELERKNNFLKVRTLELVKLNSDALSNYEEMNIMHIQWGRREQEIFSKRMKELQRELKADERDGIKKKTDLKLGKKI